MKLKFDLSCPVVRQKSGIDAEGNTVVRCEMENLEIKFAKAVRNAIEEVALSVCEKSGIKPEDVFLR